MEESESQSVEAEIAFFFSFDLCVASLCRIYYIKIVILLSHAMSSGQKESPTIRYCVLNIALSDSSNSQNWKHCSPLNLLRCSFFFLVSISLFRRWGASLTTNFITALIFISVFCSIHCTRYSPVFIWNYLYS